MPDTNLVRIDQRVRVAPGFFRNMVLAMPPLYGSIDLVRFGDKIVVTCAPTVALVSPEVMFHDRMRVAVDDHNRIIFGDYSRRVVYRITGWDTDRRSLIVLLEEDHRND